MPIESVEPVRILSEEELALNEKILKNSARAGVMYATDYNLIEDIIASHRSLLSANAELSFEIIMRKKYEAFLISVIRCDEPLEEECSFEWFKNRMEELK